MPCSSSSCRFSAEQDPLIQKLDIGRVLDRNDLRVATVWMDGEYEKIFTRFRFLEGVVTSGDVRARRELKQNLQCTFGLDALFAVTVHGGKLLLIFFVRAFSFLYLSFVVSRAPLTMRKKTRANQFVAIVFVFGLFLIIYIYNKKANHCNGLWTKWLKINTFQTLFLKLMLRS